VRGIKQLGEILENVVAKLGSEAELTLEVRSTSKDGFDDKTRRVVSENTSSLGGANSEFS